MVFIKNPIKGKVKTRIARTVGDDEALAIYLQLSKITRDNALLLMEHPDSVGRGVKIYLFYDAFIENHDEWSNAYFEKHLQTGKDLGERMLNAFDFVLKKHTSACIIGSDCPTLSVEILQQSFEQLAHYDTVLGPSTDGGYYLLGIKKEGIERGNKDLNFLDALHHLFDDMVWSTETVMSETIKRIKENNQTVCLLPELTDIDEEADWLIFQKNRWSN